MFLWLHTMALDRHTHTRSQGWRGTWEKPEHRPAGLRTAPGARALAGLTCLGFKVVLSSVLLLRPKRAGSLSSTTGSLSLSSEGSGKAQMLCLYSSQV